MSDNTIPNSDQSKDLLQELALRLLTRSDASRASARDLQTSNPQLLVGQIPASLPVELPLPETSRLLGSLVHGPEYVEIMLDTSLSAEDVIAFYQECMQAAGWYSSESAWTWFGRGGGFVRTRTPLRALFCKGKHGPALQVGALTLLEKSTEVHLVLDRRVRNSPCAQQAPRRSAARDALPPLEPLAGGTQQIGPITSFGPESSDTSGTLEIAEDISITTLSAHYAAQLERAGWTRLAEGQGGSTAWHSWTFRDQNNERWHAFFFLTLMPGTEHRYFLYLKTYWTGNSETKSV